MVAKRFVFITSIILLACLLISIFAIFFDVGHSCTCEEEYCSICEFYNGLHKPRELLMLVLFSFITLTILTIFENFIHYTNFAKTSLVGLSVKMSN